VRRHLQQLMRRQLLAELLAVAVGRSRLRPVQFVAVPELIVVAAVVEVAAVQER
jgi:hypothetical protein